ESEGEIAYDCSQVVGAIQDDRVYACLFREDNGLVSVGLNPVPKGGSAGEIDECNVGMAHQFLGDRRFDGVGRQGYEVGIEAIFFENGASHLDRDCQGQDGVRMGLDYNRVSSGQIGEESRIRIPGRERGDADDDADAAWNDAESLLQPNGL